MSTTEIVVVAFGLFIGYWVVSKLMAGQSRPQPQDSRHTENSPEPAAGSWHDVLGVSSQASVDEIRSAYRRLMSQYHPDKVASLGSELRELADRKSKEITGAYREAMRLRGVDA